MRLLGKLLWPSADRGPVKPVTADRYRCVICGKTFPVQPARHACHT